MNFIQIAQSEGQIAACFPVMRQLRPHLTEAEFLLRVQRQQNSGYQLAYLEEEGQVRTVAGFRLLDTLVGGRILYVDDLVTDAAYRSQGYGTAVLSWLVQRARDEGCHYLELDSAVQRYEAHRFYLTNRLIISAHHFTLKL